MKSSRLAWFAFTLLVMSIGSLLIVQSYQNIDLFWKIIPQLLILLFFISCIGYIYPKISKKGFVYCSTSMMLACAANQLETFWHSTSLLLISFACALVVTGVSNFIYFKYALRDFGQGQ